MCDADAPFGRITPTQVHDVNTSSSGTAVKHLAMSHVLRQVSAVVVVHDDAQMTGCAEHFLQAQSTSVT